MYGTVAEWITYAAARGVTIADDEASLQALVRASDYIKYSYVSLFVSPYDETSPNVEEATYEAAKLELATPNFFSKTFTPSQQKVLTGVDTVKWTVVTPESKNRAAADASPRSTLIDAMLGPYMPLEKGFEPFIRSIGGRSE